MKADLRAERPPLSGAGLFCEERWLIPFAHTFRRTLEWLVCMDGDQLLAAMPVFSRKKYGLCAAANPPMVPYLPLHFEPLPGNRETTVQRLHLEACLAMAHVLRTSFHKVNIPIGPGITDVRGFLWGGLNARPSYTHLIDLNARQCAHDSKKEALRKARHFTLELREEQDINVFLRLQRLTYERQNKQVYAADYLLHSLLERFFEAGCLRQFTAYAQGVPVSTHLWLYGAAEHHVFAWLGANDPEWLPHGISTWCYCQLFRQMHEEGYATLDLCGANVPHLNHYFSTFGGELAINFRITKELPGLLRLLPGGIS